MRVSLFLALKFSCDHVLSPFFLTCFNSMCHALQCRDAIKKTSKPFFRFSISAMLNHLLFIARYSLWLKSLALKTVIQ